MRNIKYNGYTYRVTVEEYLHIKLLKARLLRRRIWRWRKLIKRSDFVLFLLLTLIWVLAGVSFSLIDENGWLFTLTSLKEEYIASVIIVGFIAGYSKVTEYRKRNREQHWLYCCLLTSLDNIYDAYYGKMSQHYIPLYCDETREQTETLLFKQDVPIKDEKLRFMAEQALNQIRILKEYNTTGRLNACDNQMVDLYINSCEGLLQGIIKDKKKYQKSYLEDLLQEASFLLDEIRSVWRCDNDLNLKILKVLTLSENSLMEDFYKRMYCYSFDTIKAYIQEQGFLNELTKDAYIQGLEFMGIRKEDAPDFDSLVEEINKEDEDRKGRLFGC